MTRRVASAADRRVRDFTRDAFQIRCGVRDDHAVISTELETERDRKPGWRGFPDDRVSMAKGGRKLPGGNGELVVPRRDRRHDAVRPAADDGLRLALLFRVCGNQSGDGVKECGTSCHFAARKIDRLADVACHLRSQRFGALAEQTRRVFQDRDPRRQPARRSGCRASPRLRRAPAGKSRLNPRRCLRRGGFRSRAVRVRDWDALRCIRGRD